MATPDFIADDEVSNFISDEEAKLLDTQGSLDFIPDDKATQYFKEEKPTKGVNTVANSFQDIARFFAPLATTGINALGYGAASAAAGQGFTKGLEEGAKSEEFLGMGLGMETTAGKWVEEKLGSAIQSLRDVGGDNAPKLLTDEKSRTILKALPGVGSLVSMYESLPKAGKTAVEASLSAGGAAAPELLLTLVGGSKARNIAKEKPDIGNADLDSILSELETKPEVEPTGIKGQTSEMFPETLGESPYGATPEQVAKWDVDENGMPINRQGTQELQATELQPFNDILEQQAQRDLFGQQTSQGIYEPTRNQGIAEPTANLKGEGDIFEGYTPDNLIEFEKGLQTDLDLAPAVDNRGVDFSTSGNPEGGAFLRDRTITDTTDRTNAPYKADYAQDMFGIESPLGGTGKKGFGQGGAIDPSIFSDFFKSFKTSKTVNSEGKLIPLYHGGKALDKGMPNKGTGLYGDGLYLTEHPERTTSYAGKEGAVYQVYADIKNPIDGDTYLERFGSRPKTDAERTRITNILKKEGYDGVIQKQRGDKIWEAVAFYPDKQIKSAVSGIEFKDQVKQKDENIAKSYADLYSGNKPLGQRGFGKGQGGAINFGAFLPESKPKSLTEQAKTLSKEAWKAEFAKTYPDKVGLADQAYDRLVEKQLTKERKKPTQSTLAEAVDKGLGSLSTRIGNISQPVLHKAIKLEQGILENTHKRLTVLDDFAEATKKLPESQKSVLFNAILNNDTAKLDTIFSKLGGNFKRDYYKSTRALEEVGTELKSMGKLEGLRRDYFPRVVKDVDGLLETLGYEKATELQTRLAKAGTDLEKTDIINKYLRNSYRTPYKAGFYKERKIDEIPQELQKFYASPIEAYHTYMQRVVQDVETSKFFGKHAIKNEAGKLDLNESIGSLVLDELKTGKIDAKQASQLQEMLQARFGSGNSAPNKFMQDAKNIGYAGLLGDAIAAATQLADPAISVFANGLRPTLQATAIQLIPKMKDKVNMKDFGFLDHITEEFVSDRATARFLNKVFKYGLFTSVDALGKNIMLNATLNRAFSDVSSPKGMQRLSSEWSERFGDEFPELVRDLQNRQVTPLVKTMLFSKLSKTQPITKLEMPQKYLEMPNGRVIYMLKTFMLKQGDLLRNESFKKIQTGEPRQIAEGIKRLGEYAVIMGAANATTDMVKDWLLGRDSEELEASDVALNLFKSFGLSEYVMDKAKSGKIGEAARDVVLPPFTMYDPVFEDISRLLDGDDETEPDWQGLQRVPLLGKIAYYWLGGGAEAYNEKLETRQNEEE